MIRGYLDAWKSIDYSILKQYIHHHQSTAQLMLDCHIEMLPRERNQVLILFYFSDSNTRTL